MNRTTFSNLPYELQTMIAILLRPRDRVACNLVFKLYRQSRCCNLRFGPRSSEAILKHAAIVERHVLVLDLRDFPSKDIQTPLCSAPNLKKLHVLSDYRTLEDERIGLLAQGLVKSEWVCSSLEVFWCQIKGIPRPDITRTINGRPASEFVLPGTLEESIDLQRRVYSQLRTVHEPDAIL
ncbi:hypothetical protein BGZ47_011538 [Haplosporangium gracile]|nr:hypothetical protein BGZ47_011538 [Haplosporangium gracile]